MSTPKQIQLLALAILVTISCNLSAKPIKCFVPSKPWAVTIDLNDFEPWDLLDQKTILGGRIGDSVNITIIVETTKPGTTPQEMRKLYGYRYADNSGQKQTIEEIDFNNIAAITYKWSTPNLPDVNETVRSRVKEWTKDMWGFNGYIVKDDIAFDIHLSADMSKITKNQVLDIIKSFQVAPSTEIEEFGKLYKDLDRNISDYDKVTRLRRFTEKYPGNSIGMCLLAEQYLHSKQLKLAKETYLKSLEYNKTQPFAFPALLWSCYDGLGMACGMAGEYPVAQKYLELGYKLASEMKDSERLSISAYNFACLYAETNKIDECLKYLAEAIKLNPEYKKEVTGDSSFSKIKEDVRFKNLVGN
jgi:tetratricopeptide (TPR) repeat protein